MTKERIEIIRQSLIPFVKKELLEINYDGLGKSDATEFEKDLNEVLDLAIKALEQQPCNDCISRQALINSYNVIETPVGYRKVVDMQVVEDIPPVTPTRKQMEWINIKKQLPPIGLDVLICDIDGDIYLTHRTEYVGHNSWSFYDESGNQIKDVRAWQPLSEPYEEK